MLYLPAMWVVLLSSPHGLPLIRVQIPTASLLGTQTILFLHYRMNEVRQNGHEAMLILIIQLI